MLESMDQIELVGSFANAGELLRSELATSADAALLDYSLDSDGLNGVELGIHLRNLNELIGVVIYSQFSVAPMVRLVPQSMLGGWSFIQKRASASPEDYFAAIAAAASGKGNWPEILESTNEDLSNEAGIFFRLTPRQRSIMALASQGKSTQEIASQLELSYAHVRKELSRAYEVLLPEARDSIDLKTSAVLKYLDLMKVSQ